MEDFAKIINSYKVVLFATWNLFAVSTFHVLYFLEIEVYFSLQKHLFYIKKV